MKKTLAAILALVLMLTAVPCALADWGTGSGTYSVTGSTNLFSASKAQLDNINLAVGKLSSFDIGYGAAFSFNAAVGPRTAENGYKNGVNGRGVSVRGGGVGQVASTLYMALKQLDGISFTSRKTYGSAFTGSYVASSDDAVVVDYNNHVDLSFVNYEGDLHIEMWVSTYYVSCSITVNPKGSGDIGIQIGYAEIPLIGTSTLKNNVALAASAINGTSLSYYETFSFNQVVGPRTAVYGYGDAINGRGVRVTGGGVAQVASVIYLATKNLSNIKITSLSTYGSNYNQNYVQNENDAVVTDYNNNTDFCFVYRGYGTLTLMTYVNTYGNKLICEVYENTGW